jgi:hypothetical protein
MSAYMISYTVRLNVPRTARAKPLPRRNILLDLLVEDGPMSQSSIGHLLVISSVNL